ncbi:MAG TPA: hypothetical protein VMA34_03335, partial [Terracidiphilus sp.]|nr:hypothetical protein [Terracidiphilus sp.]
LRRIGAGVGRPLLPIALRPPLLALSLAVLPALRLPVLKCPICVFPRPLVAGRFTRAFATAPSVLGPSPAKAQDRHGRSQSCRTNPSRIGYAGHSFLSRLWAGLLSTA